MYSIKNLFGLKLTPDEFASIATKELQKQNKEGMEIVYREDNFSLSFRAADGTMGSTYYLANAYAEYCAAPYLKRGKVLESFFSQIVDVPEKLEEAIPNILVRVHERSYFEEWKLQLKTGMMPGVEPEKIEDLIMPYEPLTEHFARGLAYDSEQFVQPINKRLLADWNTKFEDLVPIGLENLNKLTPDPFQMIAPGLYMSQYNDTHDASRILLLDRIRECKVMGRHLVMMPNRNVLLIGGESDSEVISGMLGLVEDVLKQPRAMVPIPLVLSEDTWHIWQVPPDHPEASRLNYWRAVGLSEIYNSQKALLDKLYEQEGQEEEVFVATFNAMHKPETGAVRTAAAWTEGVPTLLPKVESIFFTRADADQPDDSKFVLWTDAERVVGHMMKPMGMYPERYRVDSFPTETELQKMPKFM